MDKYWEKKVKEVVRISEECGYKILGTEFWMNKPAILCSLVIDLYKSKERVVKTIEGRLEQILEEDLDDSRN